jgi:hypothetical protein
MICGKGRYEIVLQKNGQMADFLEQIFGGAKYNNYFCIPEIRSNDQFFGIDYDY